MQPITGILLVNLGTPASPKPRDVYKYLIEFLTDGRVIDLPWLQRQLLVRGFIVPTRYRLSAKAYSQIWTKEGSPLLIYGQRIKDALQKTIGKHFKVELAMRYQEPSIKNALNSLLDKGIDHLIVLPLFPQYASATTGSVHQKIQEELSKRQIIPKVTLINHYATNPAMINAFSAIAEQFPLTQYDHVLFSFHGLPQRQIKNADRHRQCLASEGCCSTLNSCNKNCYSAQCHGTGRAIAAKLGLAKNSYSFCFQSRLGKDPWLEPYASVVIENLAKQGKKNVLVICPSFVCDCLETIYEIQIEYGHAFKKAGGNRLDLVPGLNDHPLWIDALRSIILQHT